MVGGTLIRAVSDRRELEKRKEVIFMRRHISPIAKQRISNFFTQEDGNVGRKNALMAGSILSGVMLAATLFGPGTANAGEEECFDWEYWCGGDDGACCSLDEYCCSKWDEMNMKWKYTCTYGDCP